jgi:hypothetical protein
MIVAGAAEAATSGDVPVGTLVYRRYGGDASLFGRSWTTVDPETVPNYRAAAGLPNGNTAENAATGIITDNRGVRVRAAKPLDGNPGGLPEVVIKNARRKVRLVKVKPVDPKP